MLSRPIIYALFSQFLSAPHLLLLGGADLDGLSGSFSAATTKTFLRKNCTSPTENLGYAYEFAHPWKKSCGRPWSTILVPIDLSGAHPDSLP